MIIRQAQVFWRSLLCASLIAAGAASAPAEGPKVIWEPQKGPQFALLQCPVFEVFYGGARGGGKTDGMIGDWLQHSQMYGENAIGIFVRRTRKQLHEVIQRTKTLFSKLPGAKYNETNSEWKMPGGGRLRFVYLERESDAENYQGHSYTRVYIEEATNFPTPRPIDLMRATLRSGEGVPCCMRLTGNPGGPGHSWVKQRYITPAPQGYVVLSVTEEVEIEGEVISISLDRVFIPSKLKDNPRLLRGNPQYILQLKTVGSAALVKAWLEGDWDAIDGAYFSEFSYDKHVLSDDYLKHFPKHWTRFRAMDWGSAKPFSVGWYVVADGTSGPTLRIPEHFVEDRDEEGKSYQRKVPEYVGKFPAGALIKYREWYGWNGKPNEGLKLSAENVAEGIFTYDQLDMKEQTPISYGLCDPHMYDMNGGPSIAAYMAGKGVLWIKADNKRIPGWEQMHIRLKPDVPLLYFLECCEHSIRTIPLLQHHETDPEDLDTEAEDHAADETRYACMSKPLVTKEKRVASNDVTYPKLPGQMTFMDLLALNTKRRKAREGA